MSPSQLGSDALTGGAVHFRTTAVLLAGSEVHATNNGIELFGGRDKRRSQRSRQKPASQLFFPSYRQQGLCQNTCVTLCSRWANERGAKAFEYQGRFRDRVTPLCHESVGGVSCFLSLAVREIRVRIPAPPPPSVF